VLSVATACASRRKRGPSMHGSKMGGGVIAPVEEKRDVSSTGSRASTAEVPGRPARAIRKKKRSISVEGGGSTEEKKGLSVAVGLTRAATPSARSREKRNSLRQEKKESFHQADEGKEGEVDASSR